MQPSSTHSSDSEAVVAREQNWAALLLTWVAGFSDAIGFLVLQQLGASFVSGNSMALGAALGQMDWAAILQYGLPILAFGLGNMLGFLLLTLVSHGGIRSPFAVVFGLEALFLLAFLLIGSFSLQRGVIRPSPAGIFYLCMALLTLAMGLQTATVRRASGLGIRTTFVTGILSDWMSALVNYLFWLQRQSTEQRFRQVLRESTRQASFRHLLLLGGIWGSYVVGAICGSALELHIALGALVFPLCVLAVIIVVDVFRPFER